jgi:3-oxoadipate enol-lactonase
MAKARNFIDINGHKWAYLREGTGKPLFLVHGFMCYADYFLPMTESLKNHFDIIIPDLPSFGFSPKLPENNLENISKDFAKFVDSFGFDKVNIFGTSLGGLLVLNYALSNPNKTNTVFAHSPVWRKESIKMNNAEVELEVMKLPNAAIKLLQTKLIFKQLLNLIFKKHGTKKLIKTYEEQIIEAASLFDIQGNKEILASLMNDNILNKISDFNSDSVLIACLDDNIVSPKEVEELNGIINGKLVKVKNEGHEFILKGPEKAAKLVKEYLLNNSRALDPDFFWD